MVAAWLSKVKLRRVELLMKLRLRATRCHSLWDHTVLPVTRHKWTHLALTPGRQAGTRFTYPGGVEGWVSQLVLAVHSRELNSLATCWFCQPLVVT